MVDLHTTGCKPARAAPTVRPAKPDSVIGLSITRLSPNRSNRPFVTLYLFETQYSYSTYTCSFVDAIGTTITRRVWITLTLHCIAQLLHRERKPFH
jgi:hypothetical protein